MPLVTYFAYLQDLENKLEEQLMDKEQVEDGFIDVTWTNSSGQIFHGFCPWSS